MTPNKHYDLIVAWAKGAEIQWYDGSTWITTLYPGWQPAQSYRIKPEPKPDVVRFTSADHKIHQTTVFLKEYSIFHNLKLIWDGETGKLKKAEVIDEE